MENKITERKSEFLSDELEKLFEGFIATDEQKQRLASFNFKSFGVVFKIENEDKKVTVSGTLTIDGEENKVVKVLELSDEAE